MELQVVTRPTAEPLSLSEAKEHLNITGNSDDNLVIRLTKAAREFCEHSIRGGYQAMTATYDGLLPEFPDERITLTRPPHQGVTSVKYYDTDGVQQTLSSTAYQVVTPDEEPGYIEPAYGETWPSTRARPDAVTVRFTNGSTSADTVPQRFKQACCLVISHWNENREAILTGTISKEIELGVKSLLNTLDYGYYE